MKRGEPRRIETTAGGSNDSDPLQLQCIEQFTEKIRARV
jgi:hypothetical protein